MFHTPRAPLLYVIGLQILLTINIKHYSLLSHIVPTFFGCGLPEGGKLKELDIQPFPSPLKFLNGKPTHSHIIHTSNIDYGWKVHIILKNLRPTPPTNDMSAESG